MVNHRSAFTPSFHPQASMLGIFDTCVPPLYTKVPVNEHKFPRRQKAPKKQDSVASTTSEGGEAEEEEETERTLTRSDTRGKKKWLPIPRVAAGFLFTRLFETPLPSHASCVF